MGNKSKVTLIGAAVICVILVIAVIMAVDVVPIRGSEMGVLETWTLGVVEEPLGPKTHFLVPGFSKKAFVYDMAEQVYVMNDEPTSVEQIAQGRIKGAYLVQSIEGQDLTISCNVTWRRDPEKIIHIHRNYPQDIEERLLRPQLLSIIKNNATAMPAIEAYSGKGLVELQQTIEAALQSKDGSLIQGGVLVTNFVIERIELDTEYIGEIKARQVAVQKELRAKQEQQAALAEADKAEAHAQIALNEAVVGAERDKQVGILGAEKTKAMAILAAEAEQEKLVLEATGKKDAEVLRAEGILAVGKADAEAIKVKMNAYATPGSEQFVTMEVADSMAQAYQGVQGFIPETMKMNVFTDSFMGGVKSLLHREMARQATPQPAE